MEEKNVMKDLYVSFDGEGEINAVEEIARLFQCRDRAVSKSEKMGVITSFLLRAKGITHAPPNRV